MAAVLTPTHHSLNFLSLSSNILPIQHHSSLLSSTTTTFFLSASTPYSFLSSNHTPRFLSFALQNLGASVIHSTSIIASHPLAGLLPLPLLVPLPTSSILFLFLLRATSLQSFNLLHLALTPVTELVSFWSRFLCHFLPQSYRHCCVSVTIAVPSCRLPRNRSSSPLPPVLISSLPSLRHSLFLPLLVSVRLLHPSNILDILDISQLSGL